MSFLLIASCLSRLADVFPHAQTGVHAAARQNDARKEVRRMLTRRTAAARQMSSGFLAFAAQANASAARGARAVDA
jgi:hypothetical protein